MVSIEEQSGRSWRVQPLAVSIGMRARDFENAHILEAPFFEERNHRLGTSADLSGRETLEADAGDSNEPLEVLEIPIEVTLALGRRGLGWVEISV